ncbi:MAG: PhoU domain-containing protein [Planctomycetota bacterium]
MAEPAFVERLGTIKGVLIEQGGRVVELVERGFAAFFDGDPSAAKQVIAGDEPIDDADLEIERLSIELLADAARESNELDVASLRSVLVVVKANNELERIADGAVSIAEIVPGDDAFEIPPTFRVVTNSVVGIVRDAVASLERDDAKLARLVLQSEDCVREFKVGLLKDADRRIAAGTLTVDQAFTLHEVASIAELMADHATNIAEQVIYATTGVVVRHHDGKWVEVE